MTTEVENEEGAAVAASSGAAPETQAATPGPSEKVETTYVLLTQREGAAPGVWVEVGGDAIAAKSSEAAIRQHAETTKSASPDGTYVAVPSRSWRPVAIKTKTTTTLVLGDA